MRSAGKPPWNGRMQQTITMQPDGRADQHHLVQRIVAAEELDRHVVDRKHQRAADGREDADQRKAARWGKVGGHVACRMPAPAARSVLPATWLSLPAPRGSPGRACRGSASGRPWKRRRPPPCRNGSAARRSAARSRRGQHHADVGRVQHLAVVLDHAGAGGHASRGQRDVARHHHIARPGAFGDPLVGLVRAIGDEDRSRPADGPKGGCRRSRRRTCACRGAGPRAPPRP